MKPRQLCREEWELTKRVQKLAFLHRFCVLTTSRLFSGDFRRRSQHLISNPHSLLSVFGRRIEVEEIKKDFNSISCSRPSINFLCARLFHVVVVVLAALSSPPQGTWMANQLNRHRAWSGNISKKEQEKRTLLIRFEQKGQLRIIETLNLSISNFFPSTLDVGPAPRSGPTSYVKLDYMKTFRNFSTLFSIGECFCYFLGWVVIWSGFLMFSTICTLYLFSMEKINYKIFHFPRLEAESSLPLARTTWHTHIVYLKMPRCSLSLPNITYVKLIINYHKKPFASHYKRVLEDDAKPTKKERSFLWVKSSFMRTHSTWSLMTTMMRRKINEKILNI